VWHGPGPLSFLFMVFILLFVNVGLLDLAHVWASSRASHVDTAGRCESEEQAEHVASPGEPQESGCGLGFSASTCGIMRAVRNVVGSRVALVCQSLVKNKE